ncbi:hypothetical protein [Clostridium neonatale]|uniref:hypothetical protein n=1 Tax=Clostridium neonatale TaxID=137838 RepID=UPI00291C03A2|nr:hypothetical protein [Clostridium neonatale]CAI3534800.1 hypothetical protein CNEO3_1060002 [Clostridium neonatale]
MKEELLALQELFKETMERYGIEYASATTLSNSTWITIQLNDGSYVDVKDLRED